MLNDWMRAAYVHSGSAKRWVNEIDIWRDGLDLIKANVQMENEKGRNKTGMNRKIIIDLFGGVDGLLIPNIIFV